MKVSGVVYIGEIPAHWTICRVKDKCRLIGGSTPSPQEIGDEFGLYWATPTDFEDSTRSLEHTSRKISAIGHKEIGKTLVRRGSVLISCRAPAGKVAYVTSSLSFNQGCKGLIPSQGINGVYAFYVMVSMRLAIESEARGTTFQEISGVNLGRLHITAPPLPEQRAIADYLDRQTALIDQRLTTLADKKAVLAELRKATIHEAVTKGLNKTAPMKDTGVTWIGEIPQEWRLMTFKSVVKFREGPGIMAADFKDTGVPLLRIGNITQGLVTLEGCNYLDPAKVHRQWSQFKVRLGELIISASASVGIVSEVGLDAVGAIPYTGLITLRPSSHVLNNYLRYFVVSQLFVDQIADFQKGATIQHYGPTHLKQMLIPLPLIDEQKSIADHLDQQTQQFDAQLATLDEQAQVLKELRKAIIHEAVTGKIDLSGYTPQPRQAIAA